MQRKRERLCVICYLLRNFITRHLTSHVAAVTYLITLTLVTKFRK